MSDATELSTLEIQKRFYSPLCTPSEIERVFNPQNAADFLLALRSHYIIDNMRIYRFFLRAWRTQGADYSLERNFETDHYYRYLEALSIEDRETLRSVTFGNVFTKEANGQIFISPFGRIVTISQSLKYFLEYSHLALKHFSSEIPSDVRFAALIIALRVMFEFEALDFEVDPRGKFSEEVALEMRRPIPEQLQFIVGHEFAHHLLGHLSGSCVHNSSLYAERNTSHEALSARVYSTSQEQEFSADVAALMNPEITNVARASFLNSTLIWFGALELYQHARDVIMPLPAWKSNSHPTARERHLRLLREVETRYSRVSESVILAVDSFKQPLSEYLSLQMESFEPYGSMYLGAPNTEWRGPELIDREDYY